MRVVSEAQTAGTAPGRRERAVAVVLFVATLASVFYAYGTQWASGDPLRDSVVALASAKFALALMSILLAHEMAHYAVARAHGFRLSLPYFIPFPAAFGTFGAVIRLRSLPRDRTALLEMGAAGPLAGLVVALVALALGLPATVEGAVLEVPLSGAPAAPGPFAVAVERLLAPLAHLLPPVDPADVPVMVLANPPVMDVLGTWILGAPPGRYATLDPLATAGWVGCLLTAINLLPIGQLDGGHVFNALWPQAARAVSRSLLVVAFLAGAVWAGWAFWACVLFLIGAWASLPVPPHPPPTVRARLVALAALAAFAATFMPRPLEVDHLPLWRVLLTVEADRLQNPSAMGHR